MARYEVTGPDGKRYEVSAPDGASDKDVLAYLETEAPKLPAQQPPQGNPYDGWGQYGKDLARTIGQGVTLGFGDELTAAVRSGLGQGSYSDMLEQERGAIDRFAQENPGTALTAELAGGLALPGLGATGAVARAPGILAKVARSTAIGAGYGAAGGFASGEGGFSNRVSKAGTGTLVGGGIGAAIPAGQRLAGALFKGADRAATRVIDNEESARLYLADRLRAQGLDEAQIAAELQRGQQVRQFANGTADLPETIADMSPATQRILRGIKVGGDADEIIEPFLAGRQTGVRDLSRGAEAGGQFGRINEQLRLSLGIAGDDLPVAMERLTGRRKAEADSLFAAARNNSQPFDLSTTLQAHNLRAMAVPDQTVRNRLLQAVQMFTQSGKYGRYGQNQFPVNDIERFHNAKVALDDLIAGAKGNERRLLTMFKHDLMDQVFGSQMGGKATRNAAYRNALDNYASQSSLIDAAERGQAFYRGKEKLTAKEWASMPEAEKKMFRAGWLHEHTVRAGRKAQGPTGDFSQFVRTPNIEKQLRFIMPPTAGTKGKFGMPGGNRAKLTELIGREQRISMTANKVLGNSSTAEKAIDAIDVGAMVRSLRYIKDQGGLINAAVNAVADSLEKMSAIKGERARYLAEQLLATDPAQQAAFLGQVAMTYGRKQAQKIRWISDAMREAWTGSATAAAGRALEQ